MGENVKKFKWSYISYNNQKSDTVAIIQDIFTC